MESLELKVNKYYDGYDEDSRLIKDNSHSVEFITSTRYLDNYIWEDDKVLEVGAATGRYSFYFAEKGCDVVALELLQNHVDIMNDKINDKSLKIKPIKGNALDLSRFEDDTFDCVLCLGPIYHLINEEDRIKCIKECLRVLKPGGYISVAYISKYAHFVDMIKRDKDEINNINLHKAFETGVENSGSDGCFYLSSYEEIESLMKNNSIEKIKHIATDGIGDMIRSSINEFSKEEFDLWMKYHLDTCENPNLIGYSKHCLYIGRKDKC